MADKKKPSRLIAILFTVLAVGSLTTSLLLLARGRTNDGLLAMQLLASMLLTVVAIATWVVYFRQWVDFEVRRLEESTITEQ